MEKTVKISVGGPSVINLRGVHAEQFLKCMKWYNFYKKTVKYGGYTLFKDKIVGYEVTQK